MKRRLAFLVCIGATTQRMRKELCITSERLHTYLEHPEVQAEVATVDNMLAQRTERRYLQLFPKAVQAMADRLEGRPPKKGRVTVELDDIKLVFKAFQRIEQEGAVSPGAPIQNTNVFIQNQEDAGAAMELLKRDRAERALHAPAKKHATVEISDAIEVGGSRS